MKPEPDFFCLNCMGKYGLEHESSSQIAFAEPASLCNTEYNNILCKTSTRNRKIAYSKVMLHGMCHFKVINWLWEALKVARLGLFALFEASTFRIESGHGLGNMKYILWWIFEIGCDDLNLLFVYLSVL